MDEVREQKQCSCELCCPNWHLGESDELLPEPEQKKEPATPQNRPVELSVELEPVCA